MTRATLHLSNLKENKSEFPVSYTRNTGSRAETPANTSGLQKIQNQLTMKPMWHIHGGMGCGSHHGKSKSHKKKHSKKRRGGMGCGSHHGSKKKHKKKHSKMRRGGMGCGSHHGTKKKRKSKRK